MTMFIPLDIYNAENELNGSQGNRNCTIYSQYNIITKEFIQKILILLQQYPLK